MRRIRLLSLAIIIFFSDMTTSALYVMTSTQKGARLVVRVYLANCLKFRDIQLGKGHGSFIKGFTLKDVKIVDPEELPKGSVLQMGELHFALSSSRRREANWGCPFRKFHPAWIRIVRQDHRIGEATCLASASIDDPCSRSRVPSRRPTRHRQVR